MSANLRLGCMAIVSEKRNSRNEVLKNSKTARIAKIGNARYTAKWYQTKRWKTITMAFGNDAMVDLPEELTTMLLAPPREVLPRAGNRSSKSAPGTPV